MKGKNPEDDKLIHELLMLGELHPTDKVYDEDGRWAISILSTSKFINRKSKGKNNDRVEWKVDDPFIIGELKVAQIRHPKFGWIFLRTGPSYRFQLMGKSNSPITNYEKDCFTSYKKYKVVHKMTEEEKDEWQKDDWEVYKKSLLDDVDKKPTFNGFTEEKTTGTISIGDTVISKGFMHGGLLPEGNEYIVKSISSAIGELRCREYFLRLEDADNIGHNSKSFTLKTKQQTKDLVN